MPNLSSAGTGTPKGQSSVVRFADETMSIGSGSMGAAGSGSAIDYSDNIEPMKEYCRELAKRNQTLELQLAGTVKIMQKELKKTRDRALEQQEVQKMMLLRDMDAALADQQKRLEKSFAMTGGSIAPEMTEAQRRKLAAQNAPKPIHASKSTMGLITNHMTEMDIKVVQLKEIFRHGDPMEERRISINKINACVRGWLQRNHYAAYQRGIREWKWLRCRQIVWLLDMNVDLQKKLDSGIEQLKVVQSFRMLYKVYTKWLAVTKTALPVRRAMYQAAMAKADAKNSALMLKVWTAFKSVTVGGKSTKQANLLRRQMIDEIREELSAALKAKGEIGVVPVDDIERVLYRKVLKIFLDKKRELLMKSVLLNGFWKNVQMHRHNNQVALTHRLVVHAGKIFYAWSEWVFMVGAGLDRKRWAAPRLYQIHYNGKRVDNFSHIRIKRFVFYPWKEFYVMQSLVRKMMQRQLGRFVRDNFKAWREVAKELRRIRVVAIDNWRGYGRYITQTPFQGWAQFVKGVKNHNNEQQRIVNSYLRWKWRQRIVVIMKRWRHQALYGRIDGLYTRQMLIASLNEQKLMTAGLEKMMAAQTVEVDECRDLTEREIAKRKLLETRLKEAHAEIHKNKMYGHHAEQEMKRLETIVEAVALLNPRQVEHLKRLQPQFQFKQRKVNIPKDEEDDIVEEEPEEDEDEDDEDDGGSAISSTANKSPKSTKKKPKSALFDEDEEGENNDDVPSNVCPKCKQLLPDPDAPKEPMAQALGLAHAPSETVSADNTRPPSSQSRPFSPTDLQTGADMPRSPGHPAQPGSPGDTTIISQEASMFMATDFGTQDMRNMNIVSDEDFVLLERVKWMIKHFQKSSDTTPSVAYVIPGKEVRTTSTVAAVAPPPIVEESTEETNKDESDSDDDKPKKRGNVEDEMEVTKKVKKVEAKPTSVTTITWTPGQIVLPNRGPILPPAEELWKEDLPTIMGPDGKPDTLLPGDPVHEPAGIDPEDTAARMLLGFMNFLQEGDVTTMAPADRRDWTLEVLGSINRSKAQEAETTLFEATKGIPEESPHFHKSTTGKTTRKDLQAATELVGGAKDWRAALLTLRTMYPGAGNYSGVGVELDASESQLYQRIVNMRETLGHVVHRQASKFEQKMQRSRNQAAYREKLILAAKAKAEAEEAERKRIEAEELAEAERKAAEEAAKMAAFRAAKAARKLAGDDSSDSEDEDENEDFDIVNPYANLMGGNLQAARAELTEEGDGEEGEDDQEAD